MTNLFFYRTSNELSTRFGTMLQNEGLISNFKQINIDKTREFDNTIRIVPAIIIKRTGDIYAGEDAYKWLYTVKQINNNRTRQHNFVGNIPQNNSGILEYSEREMGSFSDDFAHINQNTPQPQRYDFLSDKQALIFTAPDDKSKIAEGAHTNLASELVQGRQSFDREIAARNKSIHSQVLDDGKHKPMSQQQPQNNVYRKNVLPKISFT